MYRGYQPNNINEPRERSRDRPSKDRNYYEPQSTSSANMAFDNYGRPYNIGSNISSNTNLNMTSANSYQISNKKRVKFDDEQDVRVFKKEDEPVARGLTQDEILQVKLKFEKQIAKTYDYNWDQKKHFDALSQQNSIKEQKEKEKELYEKLMSMKQQIQFYLPQALDLPEEVVVANQVQAADSIQKEAHAQRISDVLGCYYTTVNQIPNQPTFEVTTANNKNQPKIIKFHPVGINQSQQFMSKTIKNEKSLKGILKVTQKRGGSTSQTRTNFKSNQPARVISPRLIFFLKDMQINKPKYTKEMTEAILKPFKQSGELDYLLKNQSLLNQLLKAPIANIGQGASQINNHSNFPQVNTNVQANIYSHSHNNQQPQSMQGRSSLSPSPNNELKPYFLGGQPNKGSIGHRNDKFKTVPCKYFHSHQGCVKTQNCTFIHDERYAGVPTPSMSNYTPTMAPINSSYTQSVQQPPLVPYNAYSNSQVTVQDNGPQQSGGGQSYYNQNYHQKQYIPNSHGANNSGTTGYTQNYQSGVSYGSQNYQGQNYNNNQQHQGYHNNQQSNQGYYSQGYVNKGIGSSYPSHHQQGQYGMYNNQNNQYRANSSNQNPNNNPGNNHSQ